MLRMCKAATCQTGGRCEPMAPVLVLAESDRQSTDVTVLLGLDCLCVGLCVGVSHTPSDGEPSVTAVTQTTLSRHADKSTHSIVQC